MNGDTPDVRSHASDYCGCLGAIEAHPLGSAGCVHRSLVRTFIVIDGSDDSAVRHTCNAYNAADRTRCGYCGQAI